METKNVTLRLSTEATAYVLTQGSSVTEGINNIISQLQQHERHADIELKGIFTPEEWKFLADSLNGTMTLDDFRFSNSALVAHCEDSQIYEGCADKWNINLIDLNAKCANLTAAQVEALYRRVEKFWKHPETDLEQWAAY